MKFKRRKRSYKTVSYTHLIVNALRKFESAGVIESRSSGMKGTYIKVVNDHVFSELERIKAEKEK